jgi:hypothetical protein
MPPVSLGNERAKKYWKNIQKSNTRGSFVVSLYRQSRKKAKTPAAGHSDEEAKVRDDKCDHKSGRR